MPQNAHCPPCLSMALHFTVLEKLPGRLMSGTPDLAIYLSCHPSRYDLYRSSGHLLALYLQGATEANLPGGAVSHSCGRGNSIGGALLKKIHWWARPCGHNDRGPMLSLEATAEKLEDSLFIGNIVTLCTKWLRKEGRFAICSMAHTPLWIDVPKGP